MFSTTGNKSFFSSKSKKVDNLKKSAMVVKPEITTVVSTAPSTPVRVEVPVEAGHCHFHRSKTLDLYCKVHQETICSNCLVTHHHDCHKHESLEKGTSPFQPIEEAAEELKGQVNVMVAAEKAKEDTLVAAMNTLNATQEDIEAQVASLSTEVKAARDRLVQEAKSWCEQHMLRLEFVAQCKDEALAHQIELLQPKADAVDTYLRNITTTLSSASAVDQVITTCHRLLEKVSPVTELTFAELEPVETANLVFKQDGKDGLLSKIQLYGLSGTPEDFHPKPVVEVVEEPVEVEAEAETEEEENQEDEEQVEEEEMSEDEMSEEEVEEEEIFEAAEEEQEEETPADEDLFSFR